MNKHEKCFSLNQGSSTFEFSKKVRLPNVFTVVWCTRATI